VGATLRRGHFGVRIEVVDLIADPLRKVAAFGADFVKIDDHQPDFLGQREANAVTGARRNERGGVIIRSPRLWVVRRGRLARFHVHREFDEPVAVFLHLPRDPVPMFFDGI
jgi:hypothetical protein